MAPQTGSYCPGICVGITTSVIIVQCSVLSLCCFAVSRARLLSTLCPFHLYTLVLLSRVRCWYFLCNVKIWAMAICCLLFPFFGGEKGGCQQEKLFNKYCFVSFFTCHCLWKKLNKSSHILFKNDMKVIPCVLSDNTVNKCMSLYSVVTCILSFKICHSKPLFRSLFWI